MIEFKGHYTTAKVMIDQLDEATAGQITQFINHMAFNRPVAIMPDTHYGKGAVIGFTMPLNKFVIPNVIGVDLSCGMIGLRKKGRLLDDIDLGELDRKIRGLIPMSNNVHKAPVRKIDHDFAWSRVNHKVQKFTDKLNDRLHASFKAPKLDYRWFLELCKRISKPRKGREMADYALRSIGTLGGGNHFIELGYDEEDNTWIIVHSGSRNLGLKIANYWQHVAAETLTKDMNASRREAIEHIKETLPSNKWQASMNAIKSDTKVTKNLEYLYGQNMYDYLVDCIFADWYAGNSRHWMAIIIDELLPAAPTLEIVHTVHNYIDPRDLVIRKGAIASYEGEKMIIPFNMQDGTLICEGKSNPEWNFSAPHGAGRVYSRSRAKEVLDVLSAREEMDAAGIFSSVLPADELKGAYKSAAVIERAIEPTAKILHRVKPVMNLKAK
jgi:tRNA-splicing ligase RtcB